MFLMSWTRTWSRVLRRLREERGTFSPFISSRSAGVVEEDFHGHSRAHDGLRRIAPDLHDDLEGPARRVHDRADVLHDTGLPRLRKPLGNHLDPVSLTNANEPLLGQIDPRQKRFE